MTNQFLREEVKTELKKGIATIVFKKADGTLRTMRCTLQESYLPEFDESYKARHQNDEVIRAWDIEFGGWRSFRMDSIKSISYEVV